MKKKYADCPKCGSLEVTAIYDQKVLYGIYNATVTCGGCEYTYFTSSVPAPKSVLEGYVPEPRIEAGGPL